MSNLKLFRHRGQLPRTSSAATSCLEDAGRSSERAPYLGQACRLRPPADDVVSACWCQLQVSVALAPALDLGDLNNSGSRLSARWSSTA
jgi:hypothetical protein